MRSLDHGLLQIHAMAVGEWRFVLAADVRIELCLVRKYLAAIVVDSQCDGLADTIADSVVNRPVQKETCSIRCKLEACAYLECWLV